MSRSTQVTEYVFKRHASIGAADAADDKKFLKQCFIDTGDSNVLRNCDDPRRIIVGRTGVGKSALLQNLKDIEDHVIELPPETLSLNYICNSDIIKFFENAGVKLDIFYQLLWRHVFTVELLKAKYGIKDEKSNKSFTDNLKEKFFRKDKGKQKGIEYLQQWGEQFWQETEYRIKEFTTKLETDLKAQLTGSLAGIKLGANAADKLTEEQKKEIVHSAQKVVNNVQIKDLAEVIRLLAEDVFIDPQERFYITIDRLDEDWAEDIVRYKLIRGLIETIRSFQKLTNVKIIIALRSDLLERVYQLTRDPGFQEEKYESLYLPISWSKDQLTQLLNCRVEALVKEQYTRRQVHLSDILPKRLGSKPSLDYILDRTFMRPRDAILFLNTCIEKAEGKSVLTLKNITTAEGEYSNKRLRSLQDEWGSLFPALTLYTKILEKRESPFKMRSISIDVLDDFVVEITSDRRYIEDPMYLNAQKYIIGEKTVNSIINSLFMILYKVGVVGIKTDAHTHLRWSYLDEPTLNQGEVKPTSSIYIHPTFLRVLGIHNKPERVNII